jgi:hypothetical protein
MSGPSWKWLPSRNARNLQRPAAPAASRPCLPAVEALGDRILLSVSVEPGASQDPPPPVDQILIGLLKGELKLAADELALQKIIGGEDPQALHQATLGLLRIGDVLDKYGEALVKGDLTEQKIKIAQAELDRAFDKLGDIKVGGDALKEAIGDIKLDTASLLSTLEKIAPVGDLGHQEELHYLKIVDTFGDLDEGLLKLQESILARKAGKAQLDYLSVKLNDVLVTGRLIEDAELKQHVLSIAAETEKILIGLLQPPQTDDVILT